jgi:uncharacterized UBP type Zn finger protein
MTNPESFLNAGVVPEEEKVKTLVEMGFREDYAKVALTKTHNAMQASTEYLLNTSEEDLEKEKANQEMPNSNQTDTSLNSMMARIAQLEAMSSQLHGICLHRNA